MVSAASDINTLTTNPVEENLVGASFASASMMVKLFCYINSPTVYSKTIFCNERTRFRMRRFRNHFCPKISLLTNFY